jgi:predicted exporter
MRRALAVVMPVVAAIIVSVAILTATGAALNMFHLVAMLLVIGVGTNYTLFFDRAVQHESHSGRIYVSLLTCNLSTVMGFGVIALASTPILAAIGSTVAIGAALSLLFGAVFMHRYVPDGAASAPDPESAPENQR